MKSLKMFFTTLAFVIGFLFSMDNDLWARGRVVIRVAPPTHKTVVVARPACPYKHGAWVAAHWEWRKDKHVWIDGCWIKAKSGHVWIDGHWQDTPDGWEWIPGHWKKN